MSLKPCIECGKECEILPVQLGDVFTLTLLRVCSAECMFLIAYEFMRERYEHKHFRSKLADMQNAEDKKTRDEMIEETTQSHLKYMEEHYKANSDMLSTTVAQGLMDLFSSSPHIPCGGSQTVRFTRPKIEDRIKWAEEHVEQMKEDLKGALDDLKKLENEK